MFSSPMIRLAVHWQSGTDGDLLLSSTSSQYYRDRDLLTSSSVDSHVIVYGRNSKLKTDSVSDFSYTYQQRALKLN